jgi:ATP-dependent RNA helicase DeaD
MVFCNSRTYTSIVARNLNKVGVDAMAIHGGLSQAERKNVLARFHEKHVFVLVCTDIAARGLDIPGISHVYNYDIPDDGTQYIHRIGRTARAGEDGMVVNLISHRDYDNFSKVLRDNDLDIKKMERPFIEQINLPTENPQKSSGPRGRGPSRAGPRDSNRSSNYGPRSSGPRRDGSNPRGPRRDSSDRNSSRGNRGSSRQIFGSD